MTEALSLCQMPGEIKEECRQADIASKAMLLQIVRQPNIEAMRALLGRIARHGLTREQVRKATKPQRGRQQPFVFKYQAPGKEFLLEIRFRRSQVDSEELRKALAAVLEHLGS